MKIKRRYSSWIQKHWKNMKYWTLKCWQSVEGGYNTSDCLKDYGKGFLSGTAAGAAWGSIAGGIGALPGAFVGAHVGIIGGGLACIGNMLGK